MPSLEKVEKERIKELNRQKREAKRVKQMIL